MWAYLTNGKYRCSGKTVDAIYVGLFEGALGRLGRLL
jgi:hypothetical protein